MSANIGLRFLRPYLSKELSVVRRSIYSSFYYSARCLATLAAESGSKDTIEVVHSSGVSQKTNSVVKNRDGVQLTSRQEVKRRTAELQQAEALVYPRIEDPGKSLTVAEYVELYKDLQKGHPKKDIFTLRGKCL